MEIHRSALKHGIDPRDAVHAAEHAVFAFDQQEDQPYRQLRLGFDPAGRLLEVVVLYFDDGTSMVIHAMKARKKYYELFRTSGSCS